MEEHKLCKENSAQNHKLGKKRLGNHEDETWKVQKLAPPCLSELHFKVNQDIMSR